MDVSDDPRGHLELITRVFPYHTYSFQTPRVLFNAFQFT